MNRIEELQNYCDFGEDRVYLLVAISRPKDNEDPSNDLPIIRKIVEEEDELGRKIDELDHAVTRFDERFRLYISANARNTLDAVFELRRKMDDWIRMRMNGDEGIKNKFKQVDSEFKSVLQSDGSKDETRFIFDLDEVQEHEMKKLERELETHTDILMTKQTPNGYHIVTRAFNYNELETEIDYELKTDGMIFVSFIGEPQTEDRK